MLSTACAKLAFCSLVYRMCSLFALPSETEHINMIADQFRMIPYDKLHGSPRETPRGIPRVQDSPRRRGAQKIAHNVVLSTARALSKPQRDLMGDPLSDQVAHRARSRQGPHKDNVQPTG